MDLPFYKSIVSITLVEMVLFYAKSYLVILTSSLKSTTIYKSYKLKFLLIFMASNLTQ